MTAVVYAHKPGGGNGVGLHYSRFRPSWRFIVPPNQRLGLMPPAQNRHFPPRIPEVGLAADQRLGISRRRAACATAPQTDPWLTRLVADLALHRATAEFWRRRHNKD